MSAPASAIPPECLWPSEIPLLSKPRLFVPEIGSQMYESMGANNDTVSARKNCCWIETSFHLLLADPFIRYFAADHAAKSLLKHHVRRSVPARINAKYEEGALVMDILALRYNNRKSTDQRYFDDTMASLYAILRDKYPGEQQPNKMGEVGALISLMLPALRLFISLHWSGHPLQRQFLANGSNPLVNIEQTCPSRSPQCPLEQKSHLVYAADGHALPRKDMTLDTRVVVIKLDGEAPSIDLEQSCMDHFNTKWQLAEETLCAKDLCPFRRIEKRSLATLPWMLYINTARTSAAAGEAVRRANAASLGVAFVPAAATVTAVKYNPDKLMLGPTADGQYAVYRLIARDVYGSSHFSADIRMSQKGQAWCNWSFSRKTPFLMPLGERRDLVCSFLVWQRVE